MTPPSKRPAYARRYDLYRRLGYRALVDGTITRRKLAALQAIGYSLTEIAKEMGRTQQSMSDTFHSDAPVHISTVKAVDALYQRWHLTPNPSPYAGRTRARAMRLGYPSPLAWDDIDDPADRATGLAGRCEAGGCLSEPESRGLCAKHYRRLLRNGTTDLKGNEP